MSSMRALLFLFVGWVKQYDEYGSFKLDHPTGAAKLSGAGQHGQSVEKSGRDYFIEKGAEFLIGHHRTPTYIFCMICSI